MICSTTSRTRFGGSAIIAVAVVAGALTAPLVATAAYAGEAASASITQRSADAATQPIIHVGVRQAAVGDRIPVTIVGAEAGSAWEIAIDSPETVVGTVTIGDDGTGTTLVALPVGTEPGSVELTATTAGAEISTTLSSGGDSRAPAASPEAAPQSTSDAAPSPPVALIVAGAALGGVALTTAAVVVAHRRHRSDR